ncbi:putative Pol polyprotein [Cricetulus griseus]|nr:putative Pol polyprotein [Cricetulus griseus]
MSDTNYVQSLDSRKDLVRHYGKRLPTIHVVQKLGTNEGPSEEPKTLPLKWLTDEPVWVGQWPMTSEKLEALEKLVQEQLDAGHTEESTNPWNSPVFVIKNKSGVFPECRSNYHMRPGEGIRYPGTGSTDGCESPCECRESNSNLEKQSGLLATDPPEVISS